MKSHNKNIQKSLLVLAFFSSNAIARQYTDTEYGESNITLMGIIIGFAYMVYTAIVFNAVVELSSKYQPDSRILEILIIPFWLALGLVIWSIPPILYAVIF